MADRPGTHTVIVGGGFAGVACAQSLAKEARTRVTLVDQNGYQQFQPLLYQVATAELSGKDVSFDHAEVFHGQSSVTPVKANAVAADLDRRSVTLADGSTISGDYLVLAGGAQPNFFHTKGASEFAFPLYSLTDARHVRERVLQLYADANAKPELIDDGALTFVVVGGGATGVEISGALSDLVQEVMPHRYPNLAVAGTRIILVDVGHTLLAPFTDESHAYAAKQLQRRGVELRLGSAVTEVAGDHVVLRDGSTIQTHLVVWGGGEMAAGIAGDAGIGQGRGGRIDVRPDLSVPGHANVFAVGDIANIPYGDEGPLPQLGSVAQQSGAWAAKNILGDLDGTGREPFHYKDKGIMAMIGRKAAVAELGPHRHELHGRIAFAAWLGVHAELLSNAGAEVKAFVAWAEDFYVRPHHRSGELLDPSQVELPKIHWGQSTSKAPGPDVTISPPSLTNAEFATLFHEVSNWSRWGTESARGTLNYLTVDRVVAAARLVRTGISVSLSLPMDSDARLDNPVPPDHRMTQLADDESKPEQFIKDYVGADYHNDGHSHLDALCHVSYLGKLFTGVPDSSATEDGAALGDVTAVRDGIVGRGVLLDIPRLSSASWTQPGDQVTADELVAAEQSQRVRVGPGDLLFVRLGHNRRLAERGPWDTPRVKAGLHPTTARLLSERRIAVLGSDTNSDAAPSTTERVPYPIHVLAINAMGLFLLDYLQLEDVAALCERMGRWEFLCVVAPLRVPHGTGSPVNPIAVF